MQYRMIGWGGKVDMRGNDRAELIRRARRLRGGFTLWEFCSDRWHKIESFLF